MPMDLTDLIINFKKEDQIINILDKELKANNDVLENINEMDRFGFCPLIEAVICKKPKVLSYLLENGAKVDNLDILGRTALQWAVERSEFEASKILLQHNANPNHYSLDGQPILVYPILRGQLELVDLLKSYRGNHIFAQDFISAKLLGHRFELTGEIDIFSPDKKFIPLSFEGFYLEFTASLIGRSLNDFINSIPGQKFVDLQDKLDKILDALKNAAILESFTQHKDKTLFKDHIDFILEEELLLIPSAYTGHAITFIKYKNYLAKCDRGVNNFTDTVIIYEVGNKYLLNDKLFYKLLYEPKTNSFISYELKEYLSLVPIKSLPTRSQIAGNCSFANVETSVPAMLYMLFEPKDAKDMLEAQKVAYIFYKNWLEWDKDTALVEAINDFNQASHERQLSKAMMLGSILIQRCRHQFKKHVDRAKRILDILLLPNFQFILRNYITIYFKQSSGIVGDNFMNLLEKLGINKEIINNIFLGSHIELSNNLKSDLDKFYDNHHKEPSLDLDSNVKFKATRIKVNPSKVNDSHTDLNITSTSSDLVKMTTALHVACLKNNIEMTKYLLDQHKFDVNYLDRTGSTPLMYAAWKGHLELVKFLVLKYGADVKIKNLKNGTAEKYARHEGWVEVAEFLRMSAHS